MSYSEIVKRYPRLKNLLDEITWLSPEEKENWLGLVEKREQE